MRKNIIYVAVALVVGFGGGYLSGLPEKAVSQHPMPEMGMEDMANSLKGKKGDAMDLAFLEEMITHHQQALVMAEDLRKETKRPELKKMAEDIIKTQASEISLMKGWLNQWYGR